MLFNTMNRLLFFLIFFIPSLAFGQLKPHLEGKKEKTGATDFSAISINPNAQSILSKRLKLSSEVLSPSNQLIQYPERIETSQFENNRKSTISLRPVFDKEDVPLHLNRNTISGEEIAEFLSTSLLSKSSSSLDFKEKMISQDLESYLLTQEIEGIPIYGAEIKARIGDKISYNGHISTLPIRNSTSLLSEEFLKSHVITYFPEKFKGTKSVDIESSEIWFGHDHQLKRAVHYTVYFGNHSRYEYFVDKENGDLLRSFESVCKLHPWHEDEIADAACKNESEHVVADLLEGSAASGRDLFGVVRQFNTWSDGQVFWLLDKDQPMYNASASTLPYEPSGVILTLSMLNQNGQYDGEGPYGVVSTTNSWNDPYAVSAHYNATEAYKFFKDRYGRNSIDNNGMNVISIINQRDEEGVNMDNAYWNGRMMFYGNGKDLFIAPLAKSLDVAGHEITHGVVQSTANLEYYGEPGALNESFADIFGVVIEGKNWTLGEDVLDRSVIRTGALRDMSDPNNGGSSLSDVGYQPKLYRNRYTGDQDNGGVHINSGIPNYVFYLFATEIGINKATDIYYNVLSNYLTKSSDFAILRKSVVDETLRIYGNNSSEHKAAISAFDAVGIGSTGTTNPENPSYDPNQGADIILATKSGNSSTTIYNTSGETITTGADLIPEPIYRKPSVSDDGSVILYLDQNKKPKFVTIDWQAGSFTDPEFLLEDDDNLWRNAAISKDGSKLALLHDFYTDQILVYDFYSEQTEQFTVYNPTYAESITQKVEEADAIEWDHTGGYLIFDALNSTSSSSIFDQSTSFWDIGFIHVWSHTNNNFANGSVQKLFRNLPENSSVGNPTFSKNHPSIIAFDFVDDESGETAVYTMDLETSNLGVVFTSDRVGYPSYANDDRGIIFNARDQQDDPVIGYAPLESDFITLADSPTGLIGDVYWGAWFSNGSRDLPTSAQTNIASTLSLSPNPVDNVLTIQGLPDESGLEIVITGVTGQVIYSRKLSSKNKKNLIVQTNSWSSGLYTVQVISSKGVMVEKIVKL